jgi:hypothetical protein
MPDAPEQAAAKPAAEAAKPADATIVATAIERLTGRTQKPETSAAETKPADAAPAAETKAETKAEEQKPDAKKAAEPADKVADRLRKVKPADSTPPAPQPTAEEIAQAAIAEVEKRAAKPKADAPAAPALNPEDQQDLDLAAYAAKKMPGKYAAMPEQLTAYFKKRDEFLSAKAQEFGGADTPEYAEFLGGEDYKRFVRGNRPGFQRGDANELRTARIEDAALEKAEAKIRESERKLERKLAEVELAPVIERTVNSTVKSLLAADDEVVKAYAADPEKALEERPLEAREVEQSAIGLRSATNEFLRYYHGIVDFNPNNKLHEFIEGFVESNGRLLDAMPEAERTRDGKVLVSPAKLAELRKAGKADRFITFNDSDIVTMMETFTAKNLETRLKEIRGGIEKSGYRRVATDDAAKPAEKPAEDAASSPRSAASRAPGPSDKPAAAVPTHIALLTGKR